VPTPGGPTIAANAINNLGQVVGYAQTSTFAQHGFLWSNGTMTDLGNNFFAAAINDNGQIVANAYDTATNQNHALLLTPN
jgi:probable HAF family extracellular repeat protein